ncbi:LysR family transcriptional regulator, glycine cleavage system transcriptional activator [Tistlia consotensis]|uniref:LysR family transcriptional regulator, glycine cleavage system transcriptional activator n=1 Tax=Tistlia consotensis USBA 355 TaxID=560819 RepID=A0A1Y6BTA7_9PROT|nr:transcriptional regulator GcvA [Tistlia consotensis]SMF17115.1 LysR family transcriptional regulator, glycine cleavage system transcriptional activator [Tistlia consotensis USBA 355]SNR40707.1 LysR family transcriptional regulator, glycine cleavage system transcriptional activator [Tistlia consotensis]
MRRLPPLNALRAFEAGARHLSFTKAAAELNVTQTAISHQVRQLEELLQVRLFRRLTRKVELTAAGRLLLPGLSEGFDRLAEAVALVERRPDERVLTVSVTPSFGSKWLVGRLPRFWRGHADIELRLHHTMELVEFGRDEVDMAVRYGSGQWPGLAADYLLSVDLLPVCSPALLERGPRLEEPADLAGHTLLHEDDYEDWSQWLTIAGAEGVEARRGPVVDDGWVLLQLAVNGEGVALGSFALVADDLAAGRLVSPFDLTLSTGAAYHVVYPQGALNDPKVRAFRDWLLQEAGRDAAAPNQPGSPAAK